MYTGNGQLRKKVLGAGSGPDNKPQRGQNVTINLKTTLTDGTTVQEESNICFTLGDGDVIQVYALGVKLVCEAQRCALCFVYLLYLFFKCSVAFPRHWISLCS